MSELSSPSGATRVALTASLLACLLARPGSADSESTFSAEQRLLAAGARALERGEALEGVGLTNAAIRRTLEPRDLAAAYSNLCAGYVMLELFAAALELCDRAREIDPANWRIYNNRAAALIGRGRLDDAIMDLRRALMIRPQSAIASQGLAIALERKRLGAARESPEVDI